MRRSNLDYFLLGIGSLMDITGQATYDRVRSLSRRWRRTEAEAIADHWATVGRYLSQAMGQFAKEHGLDPPNTRSGDCPRSDGSEARKRR